MKKFFYTGAEFETVKEMFPIGSFIKVSWLGDTKHTIAKIKAYGNDDDDYFICEFGLDASQRLRINEKFGILHNYVGYPSVEEVSNLLKTYKSIGALMERSIDDLIEMRNNIDEVIKIKTNI